MKINSSNVFLVLLICLIFTDCFSQWYSTLGPEGADVTSLVYTDTVLYIGCSDYGGVFKSTNHGDNWSRIGNIIPSKRDIRTLILKNNVLYVGTFDGILKSTDSGNNWVTSFSGSTVTSLAYNNNFIFGGKVNGIILSSDNGNTWIPSNNGLTNLNINVLRTDGINIYAGTFGGLFQSINNGANWNLISQNFPIPINDLIAFGDTIFAAASGAGIYMTSNGGLNWAHISNVIPYTNPVSLSKSNNKLLASFYGGGIYSTTDNGMTWTKSNNNLPLLPIVQTLLAGDSLTFAGCFGNGLYKSLTKEFNWENSNKGLFATTILSMETCSRGLLVGSNKGMYLTSDGGQNWVSASSFMECNYISSIVKYGYNIYAGTIGGCGMMKSTDEGLTWFPINNGLSNFTINNITISNNLIFAATNEGIFYSNNFGLSWSLVSSLPLTSYFGIKFLDSDLYASNSDIIYKSTNLGQNWNQVSDGIPAGSRIKNFERFQNKIYASGDLGVFFSTDSGTSWISSNNGLGDNFIYSFIKLGNHLVLSTIFGGIYYSSNAGQNWLPLNNGLPSKTLSLFSIDSILYAGTQGDGVYKINFNTVGINTTSSFVPKIFQLYQNYPNPFNPTTTISYEIPFGGLVKIKAYDITGKEIITLVNEYKQAGRYSVDFNGSNFSSGVYFYTFESNKFVQTNRMVLIK